MAWGAASWRTRTAPGSTTNAASRRRFWFGTCPELLETFFFHHGFWLLVEHLERFKSSVEYFDFPWKPVALRKQLEWTARDLGRSRHKVRLTYSRRGKFRVTTEPLSEEAAGEPDEAPETPLSLAVAENPVSSDDVFLFHKTTHRRVYEEARTAHPEADEVILTNERGELTEGTRFNLVLELDGELSSGLLAGAFRAWLLREGKVQERVLFPEDLLRADAVWLINSVRGFRRGRLM